MEYIHLIGNQFRKKEVRGIAQNKPSFTQYCRPADFDPGFLLALGHALRTNTHLYELCLTNVDFTEEAVHAFVQGVSQSGIRSLSFCGWLHPTQDTAEGQRICDILYRGIQASSNIQHLGLQQSSLTADPGNAWREALLRLPSIFITIYEGHRGGYIQAFSDVLSTTTLLRELSLNLNSLASDDLTLLAQSLRQNTSLTSLSLRNVAYESQQHVHLLFAQGLRINSSITSLRVSKLTINDDCINLLVDRWLPNCAIETFSLEDNICGPAGAQRLVQTLATLPTTRKINLANNRNIGYKGLRLIGNELASLQHLTHLDLRNCSDRAEYANVAQTEKASEEAGQALVDGIKRNVSITELVVLHNNFSCRVEHGIRFYVILNNMGRYLLSAEDDHGLVPSVWCHVFAKCQRHEAHIFHASLLFYFLREQPTLVQCRPLLKRRKRSWEG